MEVRPREGLVFFNGRENSMICIPVRRCNSKKKKIASERGAGGGGREGARYCWCFVLKHIEELGAS